MGNDFVRTIEIAIIMMMIVMREREREIEERASLSEGASDYEELYIDDR